MYGALLADGSTVHRQGAIPKDSDTITVFMTFHWKSAQSFRDGFPDRTHTHSFDIWRALSSKNAWTCDGVKHLVENPNILLQVIVCSFYLNWHFVSLSVPRGLHPLDPTLRRRRPRRWMLGTCSPISNERTRKVVEPAICRITWLLVEKPDEPQKSQKVVLFITRQKNELNSCR